MSSKATAEVKAKDQSKKSKRVAKQGNDVFFWVMLVSFTSVLIGSLFVSAMTWKDPPVMIPIIDRIDIGRHNDRPSVAFQRSPNKIFKVVQPILSNYRGTTLILSKCYFRALLRKMTPQSVLVLKKKPKFPKSSILGKVRKNAQFKK